MGWKLPGSPQFVLPFEPLNSPGAPIQKRRRPLHRTFPTLNHLAASLLSRSLSSDSQRQTSTLGPGPSPGFDLKLSTLLGGAP